MSEVDLTPLCIDLDGTLLRSDLLLETGVAFLRENWPKPPILMSAYCPMIRLFVARSEGRKVVLATASHQILADKVAAHLNLFDAVLATDASRNLSAHRKRDLLVEHFGPVAFVIAGYSR